MQRFAPVLATGIGKGMLLTQVGKVGNHGGPLEAALGNSSSSVIISDMHHYFLVGEVQHVMGLCRKTLTERIVGRGIFLYSFKLTLAVSEVSAGIWII